LGLQDKWKVLLEKQTKLQEAKKIEREEKYKEWMTKYWIKNNRQRYDISQKMIAELNGKLTECSSDDKQCKDDLESKIKWYQQTMTSLDEMKRFFIGEIEKQNPKKFENTPENLELEKNLLYYRNHYAKNQLGIVDKTITREYLELELQINPDLADYTTQRKAEIDNILANMDKNSKLIETKELEIDAKLKKYYEGFDDEWKEREKDMQELDEKMKEHNNVEIVRHIKEHWIDKINRHKKDIDQYLADTQAEYDQCKDTVCQEKVQKMIDWVKDTQSNLQKIIDFFTQKMEQYMNKEDIKIIQG